MNRIFQTKDEIRIEVKTEDTIHIVAGPSIVRPSIITIETIGDGEHVIDEVDLWAEDIDPLINALLDMKRELINDYGEAK